MSSHSGIASARLKASQLRLLAVALACLFMLGRLAGSVHLAVVQHSLCPDDGELIHSDGDHQRSVANRLAQKGGALPLLQVGCECPDGHEHEHCVSGVHREEHSLRPLSSGEAVVQPPVAQGSPDQQHADRSPKSFRVFRIAPKNSPPV